MILSKFFTSEGMDLLPDSYIFKLPHLLYLIACVFTFFLLMWLFKSKNPKISKIIILVCCLLLLGFKYGGEAVFIYEWYHFPEPISSYSHPLFDFRTLISFQVCGINNVLLPLVVLFNIKPLKDFVYTSSVIGGIAVILYPAGVLFGDPLVITFPMLRTLIVHFLLVFLPLYLYKINDFRLKRKNWKNVLWGVIAVIAWAMFGNLVVDPNANNMFLMVNPFYGGPVPFLNQLPNGIHAIFLITIIFLVYILLYFLADLYQRKYPISE